LDEDGFAVGGVAGFGAEVLQKLGWGVDQGGGDGGGDGDGGGGEGPGDSSSGKGSGGSVDTTVVIHGPPGADDTGWGSLNNPRALVAAGERLLGATRLKAVRGALSAG
jgi:hypothetical protein